MLEEIIHSKDNTKKILKFENLDYQISYRK